MGDGPCLRPPIFGKHVIQTCNILGNTLYKLASEGYVTVFQGKNVLNDQLTKRGHWSKKKVKKSFRNLARKIRKILAHGSEMIFKEFIACDLINILFSIYQK